MKYALSRTKSDTATEITDNTRMHKHTHGIPLVHIWYPSAELCMTQRALMAHILAYTTHTASFTLYIEKRENIKNKSFSSDYSSVFHPVH